MPYTRWDELSREELTAVLPKSVVIMPTAATEQHGPHLATGHDAFSVTLISERAADLASGNLSIVLTPTLQFGSSDHHLPFGGTLSLRSETYLNAMKDILNSAVVSGARKVLVLNGHGGNHELNEIAVRDVARERNAFDSRVILAAASYWKLAEAEIKRSGLFSNVRLPGHAGEFETSMMLALKAERVRAPLPRRLKDQSIGPNIPGMRVEGAVQWTDFDGYTGFPEHACAELGAEVLEIVINEVAASVRQLAQEITF